MESFVYFIFEYIIYKYTILVLFLIKKMLSIIKKTSAVILFFCLLLTITTIPLATHADIIVANNTEEIFTVNLQLGSEGKDVFNLQRFLNADETTAVAFSGAGSRGQESTVFGFLTKTAVIKFQNKYSISPANGYVGQETRGVLNRMYPETNFSKPYTASAKTITTNTQNNSGSINMCQFIEILIAIEAIPPEKATQARSIASSYSPNSSCTSSKKTAATNSTSTSSGMEWADTFKASDYVGSTQVFSQGYLDVINAAKNIANYSNNSSSYSNSGLYTSGDNFVGGKNLGEVRPFAVLAGKNIKNTNSESQLERTSIVGDVSAETESEVPLKIVGQNTHNVGSRPYLMSSLNDAVDAVNDLPCDFSFGSDVVELGGRTLNPGVYCSNGDFNITGTLTLKNHTGTSTGLYVFRTTKNLNTYNSENSFMVDSKDGRSLAASVIYDQPNVGFDHKTGLPKYGLFWVIGGNTNIESNTVFLGTVMSKTGDINVGEWTEIPEGRLLTQSSILLNKNYIQIPPEPVKLVVNLKGESTGTVTGPNFFCSTEKGKVSTSPKAESTSTSPLLTTESKNTTACQAYYTLGETVVMTANPHSSEKPKWVGCDSSTDNVCTVSLNKEKDILATFFLDTFEGTAATSILCLNGGWAVPVVDEGETFYFPLKRPGNSFLHVFGTLKDDETKKCNGGGPFRVADEVHYW